MKFVISTQLLLMWEMISGKDESRIYSCKHRIFYRYN